MFVFGEQCTCNVSESLCLARVTVIPKVYKHNYGICMNGLDQQIVCKKKHTVSLQASSTMLQPKLFIFCTTPMLLSCTLPSGTIAVYKI